MVSVYHQLWLWLLFSISSINGDRLVGIVGGTNANATDCPYQASLRRDGSHYCAGSIIHERFILTAAHCLVDEDVQDIVAVVGSIFLNSGGDFYKAEKLIYNKLFSFREVHNDVGLIKVSSPIQFKEHVQKIQLPKQQTMAGVRCVLCGWGYTKYPSDTLPNILQKVDLITISLSQCQASLKRFGKSGPDTGNICTFTKKGEGSCKGDSGGPLVRLDTAEQVGIVSYGVPCAIGYPDVFTNVYKYVGWIEQKLLTA